MEIPGIDAGIRAIKSIEQSWSLPELPPMVSLDLAANSGLDTLGLQNFLTGLDNDVSNPVSSPPDTRRRYTTGEQVQRLTSGIGNFRLPREVDAGGVEAFKERAVRLGYVEPGTLSPDSNWDPSLNNLYWQMSSDDFNRAKQGNVPGPGSSIMEVMDTFDKWMSPTGLLEAATELGLFWDIDQVASEVRNPLPHLADAIKNMQLRNFNPIESFKSVWKALGPLDDLAMPVVNVALLFSGVGQVALFGKAAKGGIVGAKALQAANGARYAPLTKLNPQIGRMAMETADVGTDIARMQRGGMLSSRIAPNADVLAASGRTVSPGRMAVGRQMQAWRKVPEVMIAKKGVQKAMQLGVVSRTEQAFGYEGGASLSDIPGVESGTQFMRGYGEPTKFSLPSSIMFEAMFTPTTVINPGVISNPLKYLSNFKKVANAAFYSEEMSNAVGVNLANRIDDPSLTPELLAEAQAKAVADWTAEVQEKGATKALADKFTGGNREELGVWMTWMAIVAAIDAHAVHVSKLIENTDPFIDGVARYDDGFLTARNSLIGMLRFADPDDMQSSLRVIAAADPRVTSIEDADELFKIYSQDFRWGLDPSPGMPVGSPLETGRYKAEELQKMVEAHNVNRRTKIQELLDTHMKPGMFELAVTQKLDTVGEWDSFHKGSELVEKAFNKGQLNRAASKTGVNPETGRLIGKKETFRRERTGPKLKSFDRFDNDSVHFDLRDVVEDPDFLGFIENGKFNLFGGNDSVRGKFTIARQETISANDKNSELKAITTLQKLQDDARQLTTNPQLASKWRNLLVRLENDFGVSTSGFANIKVADLNKVMSELKYTETEMRRTRRLRNYAIKNQVDVTQLEKHFEGRLKKIEASDRWAKVHGIQSELPIDKKIKALQKQVRHTAQEVDPDSMPEGLADQLSDLGYKLVHGEEFVTPRDLTDDVGSGFVEVNDIVEKGKYQDSLGFVGRKWHDNMERAEARALRAARQLGYVGERYDQNQVTMIYNAQLRNSLVKSLYSADGVHDFSKTDSVDLDRLLDVLREIARDISAGFESNLDNATGRLSKGVANISSGFSPQNPADLVRTNRISKQMMAGLKAENYSEDEIIKIVDGLKGARDVGPKVRGKLVSMQDRLQANPNLTNAMRFLSKTRIVDGGAGVLKKNYQEGAQMASKSLLTAAIGAPAYALADTQQEDGLNRYHAFGFALLGRTAASTNLGFKAQKGMLKVVGVGGKRSSAQVLKTNVGGRGLANRALKLDNSQKWKHYSYTADALATMRDYMRFTLSPIFDASRYTEGMVLSQIGNIPESVQEAGGLRFNMSPTRWRRDRARQIHGSKKPTPEAIRQADNEWKDVQDEFAAMGKARKDFDYDALEATTARFRQIGVLGFNTQDWMASLYADLTRLHGMDKFKAYETAKNAFTYGLNPRSAAEMNANAVFFPFSFTKKTFGHAANYLSQDWSRAAMLHDAVKTYEFLDEEYNLTDLFRERLPILEKLQRLNVFAYGLTPGELGGANRPFMNTFNKSGLDEVSTNPILNVFLPQGFKIRNDAEASEVFDTFSRVAPLFNDMENLLKESGEQAHVLFGGNFLTEAAEAERGYAEVAQLNDLIDAAIKEKGGAGGISEIRRNKWSRYFDMQQSVKQSVRERYPAYAQAVADSIGNSVLKSQASKELVAQYLAFGSDPTNGSREQKMGGLIWLGDKHIRDAGSYDQVDPKVRDAFRELAASWAEDEHYLRLGWRTHLMSTWGPIESVLG